jgi:hypothetical protein
MMFKCHCRDCQQATGGGFSPVVYVDKKTFAITKGELRHYFTPSLGFGKNRRGYCADCGSRITGGETPGGIGVTASSLDDPSWFCAKFDIFTSDAQPWDLMDPDIPKFELYPPM